MNGYPNRNQPDRNCRRRSSESCADQWRCGDVEYRPRLPAECTVVGHISTASKPSLGAIVSADNLRRIARHRSEHVCWGGHWCGSRTGRAEPGTCARRNRVSSDQANQWTRSVGDHGVVAIKLHRLDTYRIRDGRQRRSIKVGWGVGLVRGCRDGSVFR